MQTYKLYLESGPKKKKTMVHVLDVLGWMSHVRTLEIERMRALTEEERSRSVIHWKCIWTARKVLRRMLEHEWEHLVELSERLGSTL